MRMNSGKRKTASTAPIGMPLSTPTFSFPFHFADAPLRFQQLVAKVTALTATTSSLTIDPTGFQFTVGKSKAKGNGLFSKFLPHSLSRQPIKFKCTSSGTGTNVGKDSKAAAVFSLRYESFDTKTKETVSDCFVTVQCILPHNQQTLQVVVEGTNLDMILSLNELTRKELLDELAAVFRKTIHQQLDLLQLRETQQLEHYKSMQAIQKQRKRKQLEAILNPNTKEKFQRQRDCSSSPTAGHSGYRPSKREEPGGGR